MAERLENQVVLAPSGAPVVSDEADVIKSNPDKKVKKMLSLSDYVERVRKMKNGICFDQPFATYSEVAKSVDKLK